MNNFKPGGIRHRRDDIGGRPRSDANYSTKNRFDKKPRFESRGNDRGDRFENRGPKKDVELFKTTCTTCGKPCEVPFRPDGSKPVLCRDCFAQKNASPASTYGQNDRFTHDRKPERSYESPRPNTPTVDISALTRQIGALETKVNEILELLKTTTKPAVVKKEVKEVVIAPGTKLVTIKEAKPKKVAVKKEVKKTVKKVAVKKAVKKVAKK